MVNLINMPVSRETMEKYQNRHVQQVEQATKQWEARVDKVANNVNRRQWIERQNNANYRNGYDRIRGELAHARLLFGRIQRLRRRQAELEKKRSLGNL